MITTLEVTLKINVKHPDAHLDENSVKATINNGVYEIRNSSRFLSTISDEPVESISVKVVNLKIHGKREEVELYGTDGVPWYTVTDWII